MAFANMRKAPLGFSFLEIMMVMFLFGLIMSFAVPQFFTAFEKTTDAELRNLTRVINLLRNESIMGKSRYYVIFSPEEQGYHVELQRKEGGQIKVDNPKILRPHTFPENFHLETVSLTQRDASNLTKFSLSGIVSRKPVVITVDSSGFVTPFTLYFTFNEKTWLIQTRNIMGQLELKEEDV
ncbi:MAG: prepilin-type N-terminal cleavage/methylation domain-containing protein [SAR324 cluster bacterium]|nr:prepilin-type N-terminal cleavage/methylation domain-containing protein [SAR324 cluster bacterium]